MKRIFTTLCALAVVMAAAVPAWAAETPESHYYPVAVNEYLDGDSPRIDKVYQLSLGDDPSGIPTGDFERNGQVFTLLDMTRKNEVGVDTKLHTQTVTSASNTNDMEQVLKTLCATVDAVTEDGYAGVLHLDHTTVQVTVDGYATKTQSLSATRTYPNLSDADVSLVPKTIEDKGHTLTLADVKWSEAYQTEAEGAVLRYSAAATYTGSSSTRYATGYTVTANYTGEVSKTGSDVVTYTAMFGLAEQQAPDSEPAEGQDALTPPADGQTGDPTEPPAQTPSEGGGAGWVRPAVFAGVVLVLLGGGWFAIRKFKERR